MHHGPAQVINLHITRICRFSRVRELLRGKEPSRVRTGLDLGSGLGFGWVLRWLYWV
jgi:hypothetical protein